MRYGKAIWVMPVLLAGMPACRSDRTVALDLVRLQGQSQLLADTRRIDFGVERDRAFLGDSWSGDEKDPSGRTFVWAVSTTASVRFEALRSRDLLADLNCRPFVRNGATQTIAVSLNGAAIGKPISMTPEFSKYQIFLPSRLVVSGVNTIEFTFGYAGDEEPAPRPKSRRTETVASAAGESRPLAVCFDYIEIDPYEEADRASPAVASQASPSLSALKLVSSEVVGQPAGTIRTYFLRLPALEREPRLELECAVPREFAGKSVEFKIEVEPDGGPRRSILDRSVSAGRFEIEPLDLSAEAGRFVRLSLAASGTAPSGLWVKPRITVASPKSQPEDPRIEAGRKALASSNLLIILLDAASAGHFGSYGYRLDTTPNIDRMAREGVRFSNAFCNAVFTMASTGSLMTGQYPDVHRVLYSKNRLTSEGYTLAEMLMAKGVKTAAFVANSNAGALRGYDQGFGDLYELFRFEEFQSLCVNQNIWLFPWLDKNKSQPFFLYLHFREPHFGGYPPKEFLDKFSTGFTGKIDVLLDREKINRGQRSLNEAELKHIVSVYDATLNYADYEVGLIVKKLKDLGVWNNTLVFIIADHGEALWEHGYFGHNTQVYQNQAHIPFIVHLPDGVGASGGRVVDCVVQTIDIFATIADVHRDERAQSAAQGRSLLELLLVPGSHRDGMVYTRTLWDKPTYGARDGRYEYVFSTRDGTEGLYDLKSDPAETRNLVTESPVAAGYFRQNLRAWVQEQKDRSRALSSPGTAALDDATRQDLQQLGYIDDQGRDTQDTEHAPE
ncbi:MAG: sulfatase [Acidobacteriota bacterium]